MNLNIGNNIKRLRLEKGLTQEQLAELLCVSTAAVSKWESKNTYPDITLLFPLASIFGVSIDELLGYDVNSEKEISEYEEKYYQLWQARDGEALVSVMKEAIVRYPTEHRLLVRYLNALVWHKGKTIEAMIESKNEIIAVYERIIDNCTVDSIRMWAKKIIIGFYIKLSSIEGTGITIKDAENILNEMPLMQNSRDYMLCRFYKDERRDMASKAAVSELLYLLNDVITVNWVYRSDVSLKEKINALESLISVNKTVYTNEDFGKNYINMAFSLASLGCFYYKNEEIEKAKDNIREALMLAEKFDSLEESLVHTSMLLDGLAVEKSKIPYDNEGKMSYRIRKHIFQMHKVPTTIVE